MEGLRGKNVLVVGASAGIGRSFARRAAEAGANLVVAARRAEVLDEVVREAGGGTAIPVDLTSPEDCRRMAADVRAAVGHVDVAVFAASVARMRSVAETTAEEWAATLGTNLIGTNMAIAELLPAFAPGAVVAVLSSEAVGHPFYWLVPYAASKAALEECMRGWRIEHPAVRFATIAVGATVPTEFGNNFEPERLGAVFPKWIAQGKGQASFMDVDDVGAALAGIIGAVLPFPSVGLEYAMLRSPSELVADGSTMTDAAESMGTL